MGLFTDRCTQKLFLYQRVSLFSLHGLPAWVFLLTAAPRNFFFTRESDCFPSMDCPHGLLYWPLCTETFSLAESQRLSSQWIVFSTQSPCEKHMFSPFVNLFFFLLKHAFSVDITHFSDNHTWFALLSRQKSDDKVLFKLVGFFFFFNYVPFSIASKQIFLRD